MLNMPEYAWIYLNKQSFEYARILNMSDVVHWKSERFVRKPKKVLLYDTRKHHLKAFYSHLQGLVLLSETIIST